MGIPSELRILRLWSEKDLIVVLLDGPIMERCTTSLLRGNIRSREIKVFQKAPMPVGAFSRPIVASWGTIKFAEFDASVCVKREICMGLAMQLRGSISLVWQFC